MRGESRDRAWSRLADVVGVVLAGTVVKIRSGPGRVNPPSRLFPAVRPGAGLARSARPRSPADRAPDPGALDRLAGGPVACDLRGRRTARAGAGRGPGPAGGHRRCGSDSTPTRSSTAALGRGRSSTSPASIGLDGVQFLEPAATRPRPRPAARRGPRDGRGRGAWPWRSASPRPTPPGRPAGEGGTVGAGRARPTP